MSVQVENLEKNMAKLTIEVSAEDFEAALQKVYLREKKNISLPGFRKGKVPRAMIEKFYGADIFSEDAANNLIPMKYTEAAQESGLEIVSQPEINVEQMGKGQPLIFTALVAVKPDVVLGEYKGVKIPKIDDTVSEEDILAELKKEQDKNSRTITVEDRASEMGDIVTIDFAGSVDGVPFDGGAGEDYPLALGSNTFIPGFEEQLVGMKAGDEKDVVVTFPEDYQAEELKGKEAVFKCTVHKVETKELPELDDDFAMDVSEFDTLDEYKEDIRKNLTEKKTAEAKTTREDAAVKAVIENAQMDIPEAMINTQAQQLTEDYARRMRAQGITMELYAKYTGMTLEKLQESMKPQALQTIQTRLVLEKVAEAENITPTEEEIDAELQKAAEQYKMDLDKVKELFQGEQLDSLKKDLSVQKALTFLAENAVQADTEEENA